MTRALFLSLTITILSSSLVGCGGGKKEPPAEQQAAAGDTLPPAAGAKNPFGKLDSPTTFVGVVPCADCPGIQVTLTLRPDDLYFLRDTYLEAEEGKNVSMAYRGVWSVGTGDTVLVLHGEGEVDRRYAIRNPGELRMLDAEGKEIPSSLPYELKRIARADPFEDSFQLEGMYSYMADAGRFTDCLTGHSWPVAMESANAELERAYMDARTKPGQPVLIRVVGRFLPYPRMDGPGTEEMVVVDEVVDVDPDGSCGEEP